MGMAFMVSLPLVMLILRVWHNQEAIAMTPEMSPCPRCCADAAEGLARGLACRYAFLLHGCCRHC
jgi:hypothetical protein